MTTHTCSYHCDRPECIKAQRDELRKQVERLDAENKALRTDAERYRWLRDQTTDDGIAIVMKNKHIDDSISYPDNINGYIDAAMKGHTP